MRIKRIIDISRRIYPGMVVWPGDKGVEIVKNLQIDKGHSCNTSSIRMGTHTGTHVDAPYHFINDGKDIGALELAKFIGMVKVFKLDVKGCITKEAIERLPIDKGDAVFFKTANAELTENEDFYKEFIYIDNDAACYLVQKQIRTLGVDYLSIDDFYTSQYPAHHVLLSNEIGIIEGLNLNEAEEGEYFFSCIPLNIPGVDGSPARAVLVELE